MTPFASAAFHLVRSLDLKSLDWRHHGLGMLQGELDEEIRIHIWHPGLVRLPKGLRRVHDHRFTINSAVIYGLIVDQPWLVEFDSRTVANTECWEIKHAKIQGQPPTEPRAGCSTATDAVMIGKVYARPNGERVYETGTDYMIKRREFHTTIVGGLTITVVHRSNFDESLARVLGNPSESDSAIVRTTSDEEIAHYLDEATEAMLSNYWRDQVGS